MALQEVKREPVPLLEVDVIEVDVTVVVQLKNLEIRIQRK